MYGRSLLLHGVWAYLVNTENVQQEPLRIISLLNAENKKKWKPPQICVDGGEQINGSLKQDTGAFPTDAKPATPSLQASEVQTHPVNRATKFSGSYRQTVGSNYWRYRGRTTLQTQRISFSMDQRSSNSYWKMRLFLRTYTFADELHKEMSPWLERLCFFVWYCPPFTVIHHYSRCWLSVYRFPLP